MDDILHKYTAGELLAWLEDKTIDEYIDVAVEEDDDDGETYAVSVLDVERLKTDFIREVRRYEVVKRGYTLFIHDNKTCQDILSWNFNEDNRAYVQNTANATCESLNNQTMKFIGKKDKCW